ncbi:MAG TPA: SDR family oxidoreductase [Bacteroidales bacterium]|nr:SDR family oxidoreductase [Bacteroidales bacterium]
MKILITGGAGYIGNELAFELLKDPLVEKIIVYDNLSRKNYSLFLDNRFDTAKVKFVLGDLLDTRSLRQVLKDIDVVYHLAAKVSTPLASEHSHLFEQVNHWGTAELVYAVEESAVSRFIYLSTTSVYGASENMISIDTPPDPRTFYGSSKLRGESHVERLFGKINSWILRCGNVYGYSPSIRLEAVINRFMFEANFIGRIQITGNGKQQRAFIHIDKVVNALVNLLHFDLPPGIYNLSEHNISIEAIAALIKKIYPTLDMIFVNQHLVMREIKVNPDLRLKSILTSQPVSMKEELLILRKKFSFSSFDGA